MVRFSRICRQLCWICRIYRVNSTIFDRAGIFVDRAGILRWSNLDIRISCRDTPEIKFGYSNIPPGYSGDQIWIFEYPAGILRGSNLDTRISRRDTPWIQSGYSNIPPDEPFHPIRIMIKWLESCFYEPLINTDETRIFFVHRWHRCSQMIFKNPSVFICEICGPARTRRNSNPSSAHRLQTSGCPNAFSTRRHGKDGMRGLPCRCSGQTMPRVFRVIVPPLKFELVRWIACIADN